MNEKDKEAILALFPNASASFLQMHGLAPASLVAKLRHPIPQQDAGPQPLDPHQAQEGSPTGRVHRYRVTILRRGTRLLDVDNLAGGCKPLIDALRYSGYIKDDDPGSVELVFKQLRAAKALQGTEVTIEPLP